MNVLQQSLRLHALIKAGDWDEAGRLAGELWLELCRRSDLNMSSVLPVGVDARTTVRQLEPQKRPLVRTLYRLREPTPSTEFAGPSLGAAAARSAKQAGGH